VLNGKFASTNQYGIYALASQTSFQKETSGCVTNSQLFSQSTYFQPLQSQGDCTITNDKMEILKGIFYT